MKRAIGVIAVLMLTAGIAQAHDAEVDVVVPGTLPDATHWRALAGHFGQPRLGVQITQITPELREYFGSDKDTGVLVGKVMEDSAAEKANLKAGDLIIEVDGQKVGSIGAIGKALKSKHGMEIPVLVLRDKRKFTLSAKLAEKADAPELFYDLRRKGAGEYLRKREESVERMERRLRELEERLEKLEKR